MSNKILIKRGSGVPTTSDLDNYEIAYDTGANKLYIRDGSDIIPFGAIVDEDNFASDDANRAPSQQSTKAYIASELAAAGAGDITAVVAGNGLTGGATSGSATLDIGAGTGIDVAADAISVDVSDFMSNGSNDRILTATGTDAMNAEANLTFSDSNNYLTVHEAGASTGSHLRLATDNSDFILSASGASNQLSIYDVNATANSLVMDSAGKITLRDSLKIPVGKSVFFGGSEHTYIREDIDDRLRFFVGGAEFMRFTEDTSDTINLYQNVSMSGSMTLDSVAVSAIQTSSESFADNNTSLMTSAAINDRIESFGYITTDTNTVTTNIAGTGVSVSSGTGNSTISIGQSVGTSDTVAFGRVNLGSTNNTTYLTGDSKLSIDGYIMAEAIVNTSETGSGPAAITFGDGATLGQDQISLVTGGARRLYVASNGNVTIAQDLAVNGTIGGSAIKDQDDMSSNSATHLATQQSIKAYVDAEVAGIVNSAPSALNTLDELAAALGDDANFATTTSDALGNRLRVDTASQGLTGTQQANAITNLGITATKAELNYVDGVTSAIQTQLNAKLGSSSKAADSELLDGINSTSFLRSDADDTWSGNISTTSTNGIRFGNANQTDGNDGFIAAGRFASGLNIVGTQTSSGTGRQVRVYGDLIDSAGVAYIKTNSSLNGDNISSGTVAAARIANLAATKITSGTLNNARLNTDMQLTSAAPRYRLQESDVTNTPNWWMIADGGNMSFRLNNTGTYPLQFITNSDNNAVSSIALGYNTSITGTLNINNRFTSTGTGGFTIGNYSGYDRIQNTSNSFSFLTDGNGYANMTFGTVTAGTWNGSVIASAYLDADTAHLSGAQTFTGAKTFGTQTWNGHITWNNSININVAGESSFDVSGGGVWQVWDSGTGAPFIMCDVGQRTEIGSAGSRGVLVHGEIEGSSLDISGNADIDGTLETDALTINGTTSVAFTTSDHSKLDGIESGATADQTKADIDALGINATTLDNFDSTRFFRRDGAATATVGPGWMTVASNSSGRRAGEVLVTDGDSGDHGFIRIHWLRSYADSNFTVINCGGHANRITGVRVLSQDSDNTYGTKLLQVYVEASSSYDVKVFKMGDDAHYTTHTVHTPVIENTKTGYSVHGNQLEDLDTYGFAHEEGIYAGGALKVGGNLAVSGTSNFSNTATFTARTTFDDSGADGVLFKASDNASNSSRAFFDGTSTSCIFQEGSDLSFRVNATTGSSSGTERVYIREAGVGLNASSLGVSTSPNGTNGMIHATNDIVAFSSDKRLKENIRPIENALDKVSKLSGFVYNWNELANEKAEYDMDKDYVGVYAQDVEEVQPEAVDLAPFDNDGEDNSISGENYLTVQYEKLVPLLIESIKELKAEIEELKK